MNSIVAKVASIFMLGALAACNVNIKDIQDIEVDVFDDQKANQELAKALIFYDPSYVAEHVDGYDSQTSAGIKIAAFTRASDGRPSMRITYNLSKPAVAQRHAQLKQEFSAFYITLIEQHVAHMPEFEELVPVGIEWIDKFFDTSPDTRPEHLYEGFGEKLKSLMTKEQFLQWRSKVLSEMSSLEGTSYVRSQHYEALAGFPESNAMYYRLKAGSGISPLFKLSFSKAAEGWQVTALGLYLNAD